jgi:hypothetical protein
VTATHPAPAAPAAGAIKVRLSGELAGIDAVLAVLATAYEVLDLSGPRPNRYDPGQRVYLTVRTGPAPAGPGRRG